MIKKHIELLQEGFKNAKRYGNASVTVPAQKIADVIDVTPISRTGLQQPGIVSALPQDFFERWSFTPDYQSGDNSPVRLNELSHKTWDYSPTDTLPNGAATLLNAGRKSEVFEDAIGTGNIRDCSGLEELTTKQTTWASMLEQKALKAWDANKKNIRKFQYIVGQYLDCRLWLEENGLFHWRVNGEDNAGTMLDFIQYILNLPRQDAMATLEMWLGMSFYNLDKMSSEQQASALLGTPNFVDNVPRAITLSDRPLGFNHITLVDLMPIYANGERCQIGAVAVYQWNGMAFCLPATVADGELSLGMVKPTAYFLNQHLIDKYSGCPVLLFQDMRVAWRFQKMLERDNSYDPRTFIISSWLGTDLSVLPWNRLAGHDVILFPAPRPKSLALAKLVYKYCDPITEKFCIATRFPLIFPTGWKKGAFPDGLEDYEMHILEHCDNFDDIRFVQEYLRARENEAIPYPEFEKVYQNTGLFRGGSQILRCVEQQVLSMPKLPEDLKPGRVATIDMVTALHIVRFGASIMLVGLKNSGKTQVTYLLVKSQLHMHGLIWPFSKFVESPIFNTCIVDAETPLDELRENLEQHGLTLEVGKRLFVLSKFEDNLPDWAKDFSLNNPVFREKLMGYFIEHQCRLVILDNLKALMGDKMNYTPTSQVVIDWIDELRKMDICVVYVLHKDEDPPKTAKDKNKGSSLFKARARVVINVFGREEILALGLGTKLVQEYAKDVGLTQGLQFTTCKTAPVLENKFIWQHLDILAKEWTFVGMTDLSDNLVMPPNMNAGAPSHENPHHAEVLSVRQVVEAESQSGDVSEAPEVDPVCDELADEERIVFKAILELGGKTKMGPLEKKLAEIPGMSRSQLQKVHLPALERKGRVNKCGKGKGTVYKVIRQK